MDIDEALLTGESVPVNKISDTLPTADVPLGDRVNMTYSSTTLAKGRGKGITLLNLYTYNPAHIFYSHGNCYWNGYRNWQNCPTPHGQ